MEQWANHLYLWLLQGPAGLKWIGVFSALVFIVIWVLAFFVGRAAAKNRGTIQDEMPGPLPGVSVPGEAGETVELVRLFILLSDLARKLTNHHQKEDITRELVFQVKQVFPAATEIGVFFPNAMEGGQGEPALDLKIGSGIPRDCARKTTIPMGRGLVGLAASHCMILWRRELEDRFGRQKATQDLDFGYYSADVAVPIILNQYLMAVLTVNGIPTGRTGGTEQRTLSIISQIAAVSLGYADKVLSLDITNRKLGKLAEDLSDLNQNLQIKVEEKVSALRKAEHHLMQTEHLALFGEFVASVAHDIKTPLAFISGESQWVLELMREGGADLEGMKKSLEIIQKNSVRLQHDIRTMLGKVKIPEIQKEHESVLKILWDIVTMIEKSAKLKGIALAGNVVESLKRGESDDGRSRIECYPSLLRHAFTNLVSNALDAMDSKGVLGVSLEVVNRTLEVVVSDTGRGISEAEIPHLFDLFFTKKKNGLGIGLNSVKRIIEKNHGGKITVTSKCNVGTEFRIVLPFETN